MSQNASVTPVSGFHIVTAVNVGGYLIIGGNYTGPYNSTVHIPADVSFVIPGVLLPPKGTAGIAVTYTITRKFGLSAREVAIIFGIVQNIQGVSMFISSDLIITNARPGEVTGLTVDWTLLGPIEAGDRVVFVLAGFTLGSGLLGVNIIFGGTATQYFTAIWTPIDNKLIFSCFLSIPASLRMTAVVGTSSGFKTPLSGISSGQKTLFISAISVRSTAYLQLIGNVTIVPKGGDSSISFLSTDLTRAIEVGGDNRSIELYSGHGLTQQVLHTYLYIYAHITYVTMIFYISQIYIYLRIKESYLSIQAYLFVSILIYIY
jgi:hypothetical protein